MTSLYLLLLNQSGKGDLCNCATAKRKIKESKAAIETRIYSFGIFLMCFKKKKGHANCSIQITKNKSQCEKKSFFSFFKTLFSHHLVLILPFLPPQKTVLCDRTQFLERGCSLLLNCGREHLHRPRPLFLTSMRRELVTHDSFLNSILWSAPDSQKNK